MSFSAQDVKALRESTGAGMMDCKKALEETGGDIEAAKQFLREKGLAASAKRDDRDNNQGLVAIKVDGNVGAIVQLKSETDFVAGSDQFKNEADQLVDLVAAVFQSGRGASQRAHWRGPERDPEQSSSLYCPGGSGKTQKTSRIWK